MSISKCKRDRIHIQTTTRGRQRAIGLDPVYTDNLLTCGTRQQVTVQVLLRV